MKPPPVFRFSTLCLLAGLLLLFSHPEPRSVRSEGVVRPRQEDDGARRLVEQLGSEEFADRQAAQRQLEVLGTQAVASLRRLQLETTDPEIRWRIAQAIRANSRPRWLTDIDAASRLAKRQGKLLMVFSTIGEIDGFS